MSDDQKKTGTAFWITVALVSMLVGYPLSFGPACWLVDRHIIRIQSMCTVYRPVFEIIRDEPPVAGELLWKYARLGCADADRTESRLGIASGLVDLTGGQYPEDEYRYPFP